MKAIILAAGRGTRMPEITGNIPKCLIDINGKTILKRQIEILQKNSITHIYVVIGHKASIISEEIGNIYNVKLIENKAYAITDNIYSLSLAKDYIKSEEFILLNGDAIFDENIIKWLVKEKEKTIAPIDSKHYDLEELKIRAENELIVEILPKDAPKELSNGSTIGIFKFSSAGGKILFTEVEKCVGQGMTNRWFEYALNNILNKVKMLRMDICGSKWIEVDTTDDIVKAKDLFGG